MITFPTDSEGYLLKLHDWSTELAQQLAKNENLFLTEIHWAVIQFIRNYYLQHNTMPKMRELIHCLREQKEYTQINSATIQRLFPLGPALQAAKIAGLPKPVKCL